MKTLFLLSLGSMTGLALVPEFDPGDLSVPTANTNSIILSSSDEIRLTRFVGDDSLADVGDYDRLLAAAAFDTQNPAPTSTLPANGGFACSSLSGQAACSTDAAQTTCSVNANSSNCSSFGGGAAGAGNCSSTAGDSSNQCSAHAGNDSHCSSGVGPNGTTATCSSFDAGFCSVSGGGGAPGAGGGGAAGGQDNSCTAFGQAGKAPKCSAFANARLPLCSVIAGQANATCTVVDSEVYGPGAGTCSTMNAGGAPIGPPPVLCSTIDLSTNPPTITPPGANGRCTTTVPPPPPPCCEQPKPPLDTTGGG